MDAQTTTTLLTAVGGTATGALTTGWVAKFLITRFINQNDKKHDMTGKMLEAIANKLNQMSTELAVIRTTLGQVTALKEQVAKDHDTLIELKTYNSKNSGDLNAQFAKIRDIETRFEDVANLISSLRRAGND